MSRAVELISLLRSLKVKLWVDGDNLRLNAPPNTITPELRQELTLHKAELIAFLHQATQPLSDIRPSLKTSPRPEQLPLSFAQERLWFLHQLEPESPMYNVPLAFRLRGRLDIAALERSLSLVIERHEVLRTVFNYRDGQVCQIILPPQPFTLQQVDQPANWQAWVQTEANRPFDLTRGPLLRAALLKLAPNASLLFLNLHHIVTDGWSTSVLLQEISGVYSALGKGEQVSLPPLRVQYADFAIWQRDWLQGRILNTQLDYWRNLLQGVPTAIELPMDRPRPAVQSYRGAMCEFPISPELLERIQDFSNRQGVTLFMSLLAAFQVLLVRYSNQTEFTLGTPIANRTRTEIEGLIGFFVNTLVLRADMSGDPTFLELLQRVRETSLGAYAHQDVPFENLVDELKVQRDLSRNALFQVMFALQNTPASALTLPQVEIEELFVATDTSKFDLSFSINKNSRGASIAIEYSTDLFNAETIQRMSGHYQRLLEGILADHGQKVATLPLLTDVERHQILVEWNDTSVDFPKGQCIHQMFEAQAERTPENIAVVFGNKQLTYRELNRQADQLAHHLQTLGIGQDGLVGVCLERSFEMVVSLLAVLKAGGAYLPLDPDYPPERVAYMLQNSRAAVLLTQSQIKGKLPPFNGHIVYLDTDWRQADKNHTAPARPTIQPSSSDLAYVIYTSGSTGQAKGAMIPHGAISNHMQWMQAEFPLSTDDVVLQKAPFSFDASVWEFYAPLLTGGRLVMAEPGGHMYPAYLVQVINQHKITILQLVPTLLDLLFQEPGFASCHSLKRVFCGGEALDVRLVMRFSTILPWAELVNLYGPTEATINSTFSRFPPEKHLTSITYSIPIGRPVANMQAYILDTAMQPVPVGVTGELHVSGLGVGRGYLYRPELTTEKFISNPYGEGRLYKTGDLCRYLPDGNIEFIGRIDHQVKIRGFRIELGEIEAILGSHPDVQKVVVVARPGVGGEKRLVAYLVISDMMSKDEIILALREALKQKLPNYMIPGAFMALEKFPLTPNGKIDRKALPEPDNTALVSSAEFAPPQTPSESLLVGIWADLLGLPQVGRYDNFFELGGDSILSLQFINRARAKGLYLTPRQVFEAQTIEALAKIIHQNEPAIRDEQGPVLGDVPLTPIQCRFFEEHLINPHHYNQAISIELERKVDFDLLTRVFEYLLAYHDALRLRFEPTEKGWRQWLAEFQPLDGLLHLVDVTNLASAGQQSEWESVSKTLQHNLNIQTGPLLRFALFDFGPGWPQKMFFVIHHLAVDFVSWQVFISDLWTVYDQLAQNQPPQLPGKGSSFKAWAEWLIEYACQDKLQAEMTHWLAIDRKPIQPLPVDFPEQINQNRVSDAVTVDINLSVAETQALLRDVPEVYHTQINDILLTALIQAFAAWTGQAALLIDLEGHGREAETLDISRTVGWFTSIFPVCLRLECQETGALIKSIKEQLRRIPHKGVGYGVLRYLNPQTAAQLADLPRPEVCFNYGGQLKTIAVQALGDEWAQEEDLGYLLSINAAVVNNQLSVSWSYSRELYRRDTVENLAQGFIQALKALIVHCQSPQAGGYTPGDFPLSALSQAELDRIIGRTADIADLYPLSPLQAVMLSHSLASPDAGIYFTQTGFQLTGNLDVPRFKQVWQQVVNRHGILRTSFAWQDLPEPLQIIHQQATLPWDEPDWQDIPDAEQNHRLERLLQRERQNGFSLNQPPLIKCTLIRTNESRYWFVWHCHHLLLDGWSFPVLMREALDLYENLSMPLPSARPYRDYIAWLAGQDLEQAGQFWREQLAGFSAPTLLPEQKTSEHCQTGDYAEEALVLTPSLTTALQALVQRNHLTLNTLCQAAWALVLSHYSGKDDIIFGVTVSGRSAPLLDIESRVGLFINTLPLRVKITPDLPWENWLQSLMQIQTMLEHYAYTPLNLLETCSDLPAGQPLFQSNLRFQNYPLQGIGLRPENRFQIEDFLSVDWWHYPLNFSIVPGSGLQLLITYDRCYFEASGIRQVLKKLEKALSRFVDAAPGARLHFLLPD